MSLQKEKSKVATKDGGDAENSSESQASEGEDDSGYEVSNQEKDEAVEDDDWLDFDETKKDSVLETKSKETHEVHCPYYPSVSGFYFNIGLTACLSVVASAFQYKNIAQLHFKSKIVFGL